MTSFSVNSPASSCDKFVDAPLKAHLRAVIILAGGTGKRLGGVSKPDIKIAGKRLLDHCLDHLPHNTQPIVIAPPTVTVDPHVIRLLEDPPLSGPAAGLHAGWDYCRGELHLLREDVIGLLPVDAPLAGYALRELTQKFRVNSDDTDGKPYSYPDSCLLAYANNHVQRCVGVFSPSALVDACQEKTRNISMRRFLQRIPENNIREIPVNPQWVCDVDTPQDLAHIAELLSANRA
ncbi:MAG: NTP transferase domain-containing protein [Actinomycetaceae bacterium]|nr:NTP transferase domain-containing protein [Actinomycetaceae bacterium]